MLTPIVTGAKTETCFPIGSQQSCGILCFSAHAACTSPMQASDEVFLMDRLEKTTFPTTEPSSSTPYWAEELDPRHARFRAKIGGLHCSLCTGTIEKALSRLPGVEKVAVSLTHEQALIEYDPSVTRAEDLLQTLMDIGYTVSDPRKLRPYEEEERALVRERSRFLTALTMSIAAMGLVGYPVESPWFPLCVFSIASLVAL